ncbi:HyaD/HybD family hydrogenase maturation endopeptidase [Sulfurovum mangrovi]|uniref:HyaD/HybD family hydrogenase maturation endopeptidase n=1 Tax=Sulfurovum mangrovi TaxID=2893889 RepID=UPI001E366B2D|nr:HyaD/HybD family hydrogenase maturation endopeptidase [Sulfurovum mangrovi]UFH59621.1 HyaD/HybD family hydrogenase maturation endopeptidase [Sulfurovum mangrovi]UFH60761.1 HyaD/HybD family hydrogenase maturation endopeptidase [Sulfurovum mangrovi]
MAYEKIALIGIGNIMFHDEGLGAYAVKYIEENYHIPENLTIVEGGTLGFTLMTYYQEYDKVIIVGTASKNAPVGTIFSESSEEVLNNSSIIRNTANEVEITMMLEICSFHEDMGEVQLITMVPEDIIDVCNGLTSSVLGNMPKLVDATLKELKDSGISLKRTVDKRVSFESIIDAYANPKMEDYNNMT